MAPPTPPTTDLARLRAEVTRTARRFDETERALRAAERGRSQREHDRATSQHERAREAHTRAREDVARWFAAHPEFREEWATEHERGDVARLGVIPAATTQTTITTVDWPER